MKINKATQKEFEEISAKNAYNNIEKKILQFCLNTFPIRDCEAFTAHYYSILSGNYIGELSRYDKENVQYLQTII